MNSNINEKLNVIFIGCFLYPNGYAATKRKQQFLDFIVKKGDLARVLLTLKLARGHEVNAAKGTVNRIPYEVVGIHVKPNLFFPITFLTFLLTFCSKLVLYKHKSHKNIIVAFGINWDTIVPLLFGRLVGYHIVFDIVEDFSTQRPKRDILSLIKHWIGTKPSSHFKGILANGISVISKRLYEKHLSLGKLLTLVPVSADKSLLAKSIQKSGKISYDFLYSGTFGDKEGLENLFAAFDSVFSAYEDTKLILTGACPEATKKKLINLVKNPDSVIFTGRLGNDEYYVTLTSADVMMMTRTNSAFANYGFPYKLGEYLATGNPVICSRVSDISFYLQDMKNAILIEPDDPKALAEAMIFCYTNRDLVKAIGLNGKQVCKNYFNPDINSRLFYELLQNC